MRRPHPLAVCVLASVASAQGVIVSPPGFVGEIPGGNGFSAYLGGYADQRFQLADGNLRGEERLLTRLDLRRDGDPGYATVGRSWAKVTLQLSETSMSTFGATFSTNPSSTPTTVFQAPMRWSASGSAPPAPAPWGASGLSFPFRAPYRHSGSKDLLTDFGFSVGVRTDGGAWSAGTLLSYYLDGVSETAYHVAKTAYFGNSNCRDSAQVNGAIQRLYLQSHASTSTAYPNRFYHYQESFGTAPGGVVFQAIGITGSASGIPLGSCNDLHVTPLAVLRGLADGFGYARTSLGTAAYDPRVVGYSLHAQSAWSDSVTGALRLTNAAVATIAEQPAPRTFHSSIVTTTSEISPLTTATGWFVGRRSVPLARYTWQ